MQLPVMPSNPKLPHGYKTSLNITRYFNKLVSINDWVRNELEEKLLNIKGHIFLDPS